MLMYTTNWTSGV